MIRSIKFIEMSPPTGVCLIILLSRLGVGIFKKGEDYTEYLMLAEKDGAIVYRSSQVLSKGALRNSTSGADLNVDNSGGCR